MWKQAKKSPLSAPWYRQDQPAALHRRRLYPDAGEVKWAEKARPGYFAQDHAGDFEQGMSLTDWMTRWRGPHDDDQAVRSVLGRLLFSGDEVKKSVKVISGGEEERMLLASSC